MSTSGLRSQKYHVESQHRGADRKGSQLAFADLGLREEAIGTNRKVLSGVAGIVYPGELVAIMGPSGAGKTTLLNILSYRLHGPNVEGTILLDGRPLTSSLSREICRVQQEDILMPATTVRESILYSALLRLPYSLPREEKEAIVDTIIDELHLGTCLRTYIGDEHIRGVSGGEKKRVSIGVELVTDPRMIYLDEPTSGLDASTASDVVKVLRELADKGRTIVCTIHQPRHDVFMRFDKVLMLCGGQEMYYGPVAHVKSYFAALGFACPPHTYLADFLLDTIKENQGSGSGLNVRQIVQLAKRFRDYDMGQSLKSGVNPAVSFISDDVKKRNGSQARPVEPVAPWIYQFYILLIRALRNIWRNPNALAAEMQRTVTLGIMSGLLVFRIGLSQEAIHTRAGAMFSLTLDYACSPANFTPGCYAKERHVFNRERASSTYSVSAYALATAVSYIPKQVAMVFTRQLILYYMFGMRSGARPFFTLIGISLVLSGCSLGHGFVVSALAPSIVFSSFFITVTQFLMMLFTGFLLSNANSHPIIKWAQYLSFIKYGYEAIMVNEFTDRTFTCPSLPCPVINSTLTKDNVTLNINEFYSGCQQTCYIQTGEQYLSQYGLNDRSVGANVFILLVILLGLHLLTYLALRFVHVGKS